MLLLASMTSYSGFLLGCLAISPASTRLSSTWPLHVTLLGLVPGLQISLPPMPGFRYNLNTQGLIFYL